MAQQNSIWKGSLLDPLKYALGISGELDADLKKINRFAKYDRKTYFNYNVHMIENNATNNDAFLNLWKNVNGKLFSRIIYFFRCMQKISIINLFS